MTATVPRSQEVRGVGEGAFLRSTAHLVGAGVASQVLVAVTFAVVARGFGRLALGEMVTLLGVGALGQDLLDFGSSQWLYREVSAGRIGRGAARSVLRRRLGIASGVSAGIASVAVLFGVAWPMAIASAVYVACAVGNAGVHAQLRAAGKFRRSAVHTMCERIAWLAVVLLLVLWWSHAADAAAAAVGTMGIAYGLSGLLARPVGSEHDGGSRVAIRQMYLSARAFGLIGLFSDLQQLDASAAAAIAGFDVAADVGVASKLTGPVAMVANAITQVAFRGVAVSGALRGRAARSALRLSAAVALAVLAAAPFLPAVTVFVLGHQYQHATSAILVYACGAALAAVNQPMLGILTAGGHDHSVSRAVAGAVVLGLVFGSVTVRPWGPVAMGVGFLLTQLMIAGVCLGMYRRDRATVDA